MDLFAFFVNCWYFVVLMASAVEVLFQQRLLLNTQSREPWKNGKRYRHKILWLVCHTLNLVTVDYQVCWPGHYTRFTILLLLMYLSVLQCPSPLVPQQPAVLSVTTTNMASVCNRTAKTLRAASGVPITPDHIYPWDKISARLGLPGGQT